MTTHNACTHCHIAPEEAKPPSWKLVRCVCVCVCVCAHSVMSNSLQPYGLQPIRLLCPWDFQGKNTGVGCQGDLPSPGGSSQPRDQTGSLVSLALPCRFFTTSATWKEAQTWIICKYLFLIWLMLISWSSEIPLLILRSYIFSYQFLNDLIFSIYDCNSFHV